MNNILFRSGNNIEKSNYKVIFLLIIFLLFKIFYIGIYPFINGNGSLIIIFKPLIFYFIYYLILYSFNSKHDSYYLLSSLIIAFIVPINTSINVFIICSVIGNIIKCLFKNKISDITFDLLIISLYSYYCGNFDMITFTGVFKYIYLLFIVISLIFLTINNLIKTKVLLFPLISIIIFYIMDNSSTWDITLFCLLFIVLDSRYSPITWYGQLIGGIVFSVLLFIFKYICRLDYYLFLSLFVFELISIIINYLSVKLYGSKVFKFLFGD